VRRARLAGRLPPLAPTAPLDNFVEWLDDSLCTVIAGGLDHPLADPRVHSELGAVCALLIIDAGRLAIDAAVPHDDEAWAEPCATCVAGGVAIFANRAARREGRVARTVASPTGAARGLR